MNVDNDYQEMVIVPESVFYDSELGDILLDEDISEDDKKEKFEDWGLDGLRFSAADENKVELSRYLKGVWVIDITSDQINDVILHLTVNKTGETSYEDIEIQDQIWTIGLPDELLELTPTISPKLSPLSQLTIVIKEDPITEWVEKTDNSFVSAVWGYVKEPVTKLVKVTRETLNFVVTLGEAILSGNPGEAMQALEDYGNFVWDGIVSFAQSAAEFYVKMNSIFITLALCALKVWLEYISAIGEWIVAGLSWLFNYVKGLISQAVERFIKPLIDNLNEIANILATGFDALVNQEEGTDVGSFVGLMDTGIIHKLFEACCITMLLILTLVGILALFAGIGVIVVNIVFEAFETLAKMAIEELIIVGALIAIPAILASIIPSQYKDGAGKAIGVISGIIAGVGALYWKIKKQPLRAFGDMFGLILTIMGLAIAYFVEDPSTNVIVLSLFLALIGWLYTWKEDDVDKAVKKPPLSLSYAKHVAKMEEILSTILFGATIGIYI